MFKIGDWVRHESGYIEQIIDQIDTWNTVDGLELWHPKEGEWCWFYNDKIIDDNIGILRQFAKMTKDISGNVVYGCVPTKKDLEQYVSIEVFYDKCEPFTEKLPSFLKDKQ